MPMPTVLLCTDGSDLASDAIARCLPLLATPDTIVLATAVEGPDPTVTAGASGFAGPTMSSEQYDEMRAAAIEAGSAIVERVATELGISGTERRVVEGPPGPALCALADELEADVMVLGTRGHGGLRRALLGSVSDHVVRHAPCPVLVWGAQDDD